MKSVFDTVQSVQTFTYWLENKLLGVLTQAADPYFCSESWILQNLPLGC